MSINRVEENRIKQFFSGFDYKQLLIVEKLIGDLKAIKFRDYQDVEKEKYIQRKKERFETERRKQEVFYPLVRRFCKENLRRGDIVKFEGSNDYREVVEVTSTTVIGMQVRLQHGVPVKTGYSSENNFDKLAGMYRNKTFIPVKELIKELT